MTECQFIMILVIQDIEKVSIERMDIFDFGEIFENVFEFFIQRLLAKLNFSHIERPDSTDSIARMDNSRSFSLGFGEYDIDKL